MDGVLTDNLKKVAKQIPSQTRNLPSTGDYEAKELFLQILVGCPGQYPQPKPGTYTACGHLACW